MPKIIEDLEDRLIEEAKKQIEENGYGAVTIRSIAKGCGVGVGTVYNYFPSKDVLIATHLLEDWNGCIAEIQAVSAKAQTPKEVLLCIYQHLNAFIGRHQAIFRDAAAAPAFAGSFSRYHSLLRDQLAQPLGQFCSGDFHAQFVAESLLTWTVVGKPFEEIYSVLEKLF